jgi:hypothetical protein
MRAGPAEAARAKPRMEAAMEAFILIVVVLNGKKKVQRYLVWKERS